MADGIASRLGAKSAVIHRKTFPDGEHYLQVRDSKEKDGTAVLVCSMYPDQNDRFLDILLASDALRRSGAAEILLTAPYLSYARQDRIFLDGEALSASVVGGAFRTAGISKVLTVEAHSREALAALGVETVNISAEAEMAGFLKGGGTVPEVIAASDMGTYARAKRIADSIGAELIAFEKERDRHTGKATSTLSTDVNLEGKAVTLIDDMISSGGTIMNAATEILRRGAKEVNALCVHALLVGNAEEKLKGCGVKSISGSNSIENKFAAYDVGEAISRRIGSIRQMQEAGV